MKTINNLISELNDLGIEKSINDFRDFSVTDIEDLEDAVLASKRNINRVKKIFEKPYLSYNNNQINCLNLNTKFNREDR